MFDWIFAFIHLFLLLGLVGYAIHSLLTGNHVRGLLLFVFLSAYYIFVLHKAVRKEIARKKGRPAPK